MHASERHSWRWDVADSTAPPADREWTDGSGRILVIEDDEGTRLTFAIALRLAGFTVVTAHSGREALRAIVDHGRFDLLLVDFRLPDMSGIEMIRSLPQTDRPPFVMISAFLSIENTVEAMRLGAVNVVEKPLGVDKLVTLASDLCALPRLREAIIVPLGLRTPRSAAERWAWHVLSGCGAPSDLKTLDAWARHDAVSYSTLCAACKIMDTRPRDARDFTRVLRALRHAHPRACPPAVFLDVSDPRTVQVLSKRSGVSLTQPDTTVSLEDFFDRQHFVASTNEGVHVVREFLHLSPVQRKMGSSPI